jgi:hypothetical protein
MSPLSDAVGGSLPRNENSSDDHGNGDKQHSLAAHLCHHCALHFSYFTSQHPHTLDTALEKTTKNSNG